MTARSASVSRKTNETAIEVSVAIDGTGRHDIRTGVGFFDHMLDQLATRIPEKLWLTNLQESNKKVTLKGVSINTEVIATFMSRMEESDYFAEVYLVSIQARDEGDLKLKEFTVTAKLIIPALEKKDAAANAGRRG